LTSIEQQLKRLIKRLVLLNKHLNSLFILASSVKELSIT